MDNVQLKELPLDLQAYIRVNGYINFRKYDQISLRKRIRFFMPNQPFKEILKQNKISSSRKREGAGNDGAILIELDVLNKPNDDINTEGEEHRDKTAATNVKTIRMLREDGSIWEMLDDVVY